MNTEHVNFMAYGESLVAWAKENRLILLLTVLVVVVLLVVLGIPLFRKYLRSRRKEKDTADLKKDLQAWQNLSAIASESDRKDAARQTLSTQLNMIRLLFSQGMALLKHAGKGRYGLPWFVLVGEPKSGKSTLLKESRLEMVCSAAESKDSEMGADSLPVRCWLSGRSFVLDIGGKVFFDRWLGGSSAEWNLVLKLIVKAHRRKPLSGIILTLPVDALLADSEDLTKRKAALLVNEFQNMLGKFGMYLPCHVVVTKMDMLMGFREYFSDLGETEADGVFGWRNRTPNGRLDMTAFADYWKKLLAGLHSGALAAMSGAGVHTHNLNSSESRLLLTGGMYLFPEEFAKIRKNLTIYLDRLFGANTWLDNERAMLSGVYFTSSHDGHVRLSPKLAEIRRQAPDQAVLVSKTALPKGSLFTKTLLDKLIFTDTRNSSFTAGKKFRRHLPQYALCLLFAAMTGIWGYAAWYGTGRIGKSLQSDEEYYHGMARMFEEKQLKNSPLVIGNAETGKTEIAENLPMAGNKTYTRLQFFFESQQEALRDCRIPFGFQTAGWLIFHENNYGQEVRRFIANRIQADMVFTPTVHLLVQRFLSAKAAAEPFTIAKREAYQDFMRLEKTLTDTPPPSAPVEAYLYFLTPESGGNAIRLLDSHMGKGLDADIYNIADIICKLPYQKAEYEATMQFFRHWENLAIYPNHPYSRLRDAVRKASDFLENQKKVGELAAKLNGKADNTGDLLAELNRLSKTQSVLYENIVPFFIDGTPNWNDSGVRKEELKSTPNSKEYYARKWILQYEEQMEDDYAFVMGIHRQIEYLSNSPEQTDIKKLIEDSHSRAKARFAAEKEEIIAKGIALRDSRFFDPLPSPDSEKQDAHVSPRFGEIATKLLSLSCGLNDQSVPSLKSIKDYAEVKQQLDKAASDAEEQWEGYAKLFASDPNVSGLLTGYRTIFRAHGEWLRQRFYAELLALYPANAKDFSVMIAEHATVPEDILGMKADLARESFGPLEIMSAYENRQAMLYLAPIADLLPREKDAAAGDAASEAKNRRTSSVPDALKPRFDAVVGMLGEYLEKYNAYWANYVDAIRFKPGSWGEFKAACGKLKPYQINTLLFIAYNSSTDILNQVPDALLSKDIALQKGQYLTVLNARKQILAPHFSESCNRNVAAWNALPKSAEQAFLTLQKLPVKQRNADYLTVFDTGAKGDIPWWSAFIQSGVSYMKQEAKETLLKQLTANGEKIFSFPLCKDSPYPDVLTDEELRAVSAHFTHIGCLPPQPEAAAAGAATTSAQPPEPEPSGLDLSLDFPVDSHLPVWGAKLQGIIDALANESKPMTYSLTVPPFAVQNKLTAMLDTPCPLAVTRFPYLTVSSSGTRRPPMRLLHAEKDIPLLSGLITESNLTFSFRAYSDEEQAAVTVKLTGDWGILQLYLAEHAYFDPQTKLVYSPLFLSDRTGGKYVLWIGFSFNKVIPYPDDWPTTENCPEFSLFQTGEKQRRATVVDFSAEVRKAESGDKGYQSLKQLIRDYDIRNLPSFLLSPVNITDRAELPESYLRFPYLEIKTPERSARINLANPSGAGIPLYLNDEHLQFRFFRHSDDRAPAHEVTIDGPYPLLRLLTRPDRKTVKKRLTIELPLSSGGAGKALVVPLEIVIQNERGHGTGKKE